MVRRRSNLGKRRVVPAEAELPVAARLNRHETRCPARGVRRPHEHAAHIQRITRSVGTDTHVSAVAHKQARRRRLCRTAYRERARNLQGGGGGDGPQSEVAGTVHVHFGACGSGGTRTRLESDPGNCRDEDIGHAGLDLLPRHRERMVPTAIIVAIETSITSVRVYADFRQRHTDVKCLGGIIGPDAQPVVGRIPIESVGIVGKARGAGPVGDRRGAAGAGKGAAASAGIGRKAHPAGAGADLEGV